MNGDPDLFSEPAVQAKGSRIRKLRGFIAGAILIAIAAGLFMSAEKGLFQRTSRLHFFADSAKGMAPGMPAKLNGFRIGELEKLVMDADGRVGVVLSVGDEYIHLIHKDARARWSKEGLIGDTVIDIVPGSANSPTVENNAVIAFERTRDIGEELSELAKQLQPILADAKRITAYVDNPQGDLKQTVVQLRRASQALAGASEDVSEITRSRKKRIELAIDSVSGAAAKLDAALPPMIRQLDSSLRHIEAVTRDSSVISGRLATDLPPAVSEGRATIEDSHQMVDAVKQSWPIRNLLPRQDEHALPIDSHVPR